MKNVFFVQNLLDADKKCFFRQKKCWAKKTLFFFILQMLGEKNIIFFHPANAGRKKQVFFSSSIFFDGKNTCYRHPADFGRKKRFSLESGKKKSELAIKKIGFKIFRIYILNGDFVREKIFERKII